MDCALNTCNVPLLLNAHSRLPVVLSANAYISAFIRPRKYDRSSTPSRASKSLIVLPHYDAEAKNVPLVSRHIVCTW